MNHGKSRGMSNGLDQKGVNVVHIKGNNNLLLKEKDRNKPLMGGVLEKSKDAFGSSVKPKSEWVVVGSKTRKEEKRKLFGKENKLMDWPKFKIKAADHKGAHFVEITNQYSSLPVEQTMDNAESEVVNLGNSSGDPISTVMLDDDMGLGAHEPKSELGTSVVIPLGSGLAHTSPALS